MSGITIGRLIHLNPTGLIMTVNQCRGIQQRFTTIEAETETGVNRDG